MYGLVGGPPLVGNLVLVTEIIIYGTPTSQLPKNNTAITKTAL